MCSTRSPRSRSTRSTCGCPDALRRDHAMSGFRRQAEVGRRERDRCDERRAPRGAHARCGCGGGRFLVARQARGSRRCRSSGTIAATIGVSSARSPNWCARPRCEDAQVGQSDGDVAAALAGAVRRIEADNGSVPGRTRPWSRRTAPPTSSPMASRSLGADPGRDDGAVHRRRRRRRAERKGRRSTARCSAAASAGAAPIQEYRPSGGADRQGSRRSRSRWCGPARRTSARFLPAVRHGAADRRPRRRRHADRAGDTACRAVVRRRRWCRGSAEHYRPQFLSGLTEEMPLRRAELSGRYVVQPDAGAARRLARHQLHAERILQGVLHRRDGARRGHRSLSLPAPAAAQQPEESRRARCRGEKGGWDRPPPAGIFRGIAFNEACGSYCAQVVEISIDGRQACACIASSRRSIPAMWSIRCRSRCRPKAPSSMR